MSKQPDESEVLRCPVCDYPLRRYAKKSPNGEYMARDFRRCPNGCHDYSNRYGEVIVRIGERGWEWDGEDGENENLAEMDRILAEMAEITTQERDKLMEKRKTMHPERQAFIDHLRDHPLDRDTRNIYADWLSDHGMDDESQAQREWDRRRHDAEEFLGYFAAACDMSLDELLQAADEAANGEEWGVTLPFDTPDIVYAENDRFWECYRIYRDAQVEARRQRPFISCSC